MYGIGVVLTIALLSNFRMLYRDTGKGQDEGVDYLQNFQLAEDEAMWRSCWAKQENMTFDQDDTESPYPMFVFSASVRSSTLRTETCGRKQGHTFYQMVTGLKHYYFPETSQFGERKCSGFSPGCHSRDIQYWLSKIYDFTAKTNPEYVILVEDDIFFCKGIFTFVRRVIEHHQPHLVYLANGFTAVLMQREFVPTVLDFLESNPGGPGDLWLYTHLSDQYTVFTVNES